MMTSSPITSLILRGGDTSIEHRFGPSEPVADTGVLKAMDDLKLAIAHMRKVEHKFKAACDAIDQKRDAVEDAVRRWRPELQHRHVDYSMVDDTIRVAEQEPSRPQDSWVPDLVASEQFQTMTVETK